MRDFVFATDILMSSPIMRIQMNDFIVEFKYLG